MQYICLVYQEEAKVAALSDAELEKIVGDCIAYTMELEKGGHHVMSSGLQSASTGTTIRRTNGRATVTDGPFAETKEILGGFTIIEARDLNEAIQLASKFPTGELGCIEVRPVMDPFQEMTGSLDQRLGKAVREAIQASGMCQPVPTT